MGQLEFVLPEDKVVRRTVPSGRKPSNFHRYLTRTGVAGAVR